MVGTNLLPQLGLYGESTPAASFNVCGEFRGAASAKFMYWVRTCCIIQVCVVSSNLLRYSSLYGRFETVVSNRFFCLV